MQNGNAKSATPTSLTVTGNNSSRVLNWNDNTSPFFLQYLREGSNYTFNYYPVQNQEQGFKIYRKATNSSWDGTLNGYAIVGTVGQNVTNWTDNTTLAGSYSYVVVAYNSSGNSVPRAEKSVTYQQSLSVSISGPSYLNSYQNGTWTAGVSGGFSPYTYNWYYKYPSALPKISSINKPPAGYWILLGDHTSQITRYDFQDFQLKCVVTDNVGTTVTSNILYVSVGGGLAANKSPEVYALEQNNPNPFNPSTIIRYQLPQEGYVTLKIYDMLGREVGTLVNEYKNAGKYKINFDASSLSSGVYVYRILVNDFVSTKKMILMK